MSLKVCTEPLPTGDGKRVALLGDTPIKSGLYRIYWESGGSSLAAIGMCSDGTWWVAPTNWVGPAVPLPLTDDAGRTSWEDIQRIEPLEV